MAVPQFNPFAAPIFPNIQAPATGPTSPNFAAARDTMNLNPQEQALYQRHLTNLYGPGGVTNLGGQSRSTLYQSVEPQGAGYRNIPMVWDGQIQSQKWTDPNDPNRVVDVANPQALQNVQNAGWNTFPSYATAQQADDRYQQMHSYMDKDTGDWFSRQPQSGGILAALGLK